MRPRLILLLTLAAALLLPWAGWRLVLQIEALLREGQERAQIAAAQAIARALVATAPQLPPVGPAVFVHSLDRTPILDGNGDEFARFEGTRSADGRLTVVLGDRGAALFALIEMRDGTRNRTDVGDPRGRAGDRIELSLTDERGLRRYLLGNAAPGSLQVLGVDDTGAAPVGEWQETVDGYRIELRLPGPQGRATVAVSAVDRDQTDRVSHLGTARDDALPTLRVDPRLDRALQALVPDGARVRVLSEEGWVLGRAGALGVAESEFDSDREQPWQSWFYNLLLAPPLESSAAELGDALERLQAPVAWQALSGVAASNVRASNNANSVIVTAAVPLLVAGVPQGALLLEQDSDALLLLANRAVFGVMAASLLAVLAAALIVFAYAGVLSLRIRRLRDAAGRALQPDGRLDPSLPHLSARDDLGDLSRSFARLLGEVGAYTDYLRSLASKLSHELNTPLAIVRSSLDNLEHEQLEPAARTYSQRAREGAERLTGILRSMAEASRMERAITAAEGEDFDLAELTRGCAEAYRDVVAPRRIAVDVPAGRLGLHGAPELVAQALDKLVDNARSFAPADGWIRIRLRALEDGAELSVANNGPPLPDRMQERLFDSMVSLREGSARDAAPHLGLGLFVVRLVADLHRGSASAINLPDQAGVEFRLLLHGVPRRPM